MRLRDFHLKGYDHLYDEVGNLGDPCVYCGMESSGWDHVPALSYVAQTWGLDGFNYRPRKVPSCGECNALLGVCGERAIQRRRHILKQRLRKKYAHVVRMPKWDEDEMIDMGDTLRNDISYHDKLSTLIKRRLSYIP